MILAARRSQPECVRRLLEAKAKPDIAGAVWIRLIDSGLSRLTFVYDAANCLPHAAGRDDGAHVGGVQEQHRDHTAADQSQC